MIDLSGAKPQREDAEYQDTGQSNKIVHFPPKQWIKSSNPAEEFRHAMAANGLEPEYIDESGDLIRFDVDQKGDKAGWCVYHADNLPAGTYGNWKTGLKKNWCSISKAYRTTEQEAEYQKFLAYAKLKRQEDRAQRHAETRDKLFPKFQTAGPAEPNHQYLIRKGIQPLGEIRQIGEILLVPLRDADGNFWSYQQIFPEKKIFQDFEKPRDKNFPKGSRKESCYFTIPGGPDLYLCEGYATGCSIHAATGGTVIIAFDAGNLSSVALVVREKCPAAPIVICADHDESGTGQREAEKAAKAIGARVVMPEKAGMDFNDLAALEGLEAVKRLIVGIPGGIPSRDDLFITDSEWSNARLTPDCIVEDYLYADVATTSAPGGTGKTTTMLYEDIHIVLGEPLYGLEIKKPGWCLIVTAEDPREILIARLREISRDMGLTPDEIKKVQEGVIIQDVSGDASKLIKLVDGNIVADQFVDDLIRRHRENPPVIIIFDPAISFGVGESKVNDNESGLIEAARKIRNSLGCCVRFIHHTGKANAREKTLDQYTSRGGSALPDGSRMVHIMQSWTPNDTARKPPQGCCLDPQSSLTIIARPKLSYSRPNPPLIWLKRTGWRFESFAESSISDNERKEAAKRQIEQFVMTAEESGTAFYNKEGLASCYQELKLKRNEVRDLVAQLLSEGRLTEKDLPIDKQSTKRKTYLGVWRDSAGFEKQSEK
jgi:hypothetical protein